MPETQHNSTIVIALAWMRQQQTILDAKSTKTFITSSRSLLMRTKGKVRQMTKVTIPTTKRGSDAIGTIHKLRRQLRGEGVLVENLRRQDSQRIFMEINRITFL